MRVDLSDQLALVGDIVVQRVDHVRTALEDEVAARPDVDEIAAPDVAGNHGDPVQLEPVLAHQQDDRDRTEHRQEQPERGHPKLRTTHRAASITGLDVRHKHERDGLPLARTRFVKSESLEDC